ncbi:helix-turn-helix transcriptional regulator [Gryllotalpicola koreensis]|uniref:HTH luxR-type domain-containing protein n=1 Tax=Gryllotalpicola koreensis TaxID=993086 RepID=A0ABP8A0K8_9MICO
MAEPRPGEQKLVGDFVVRQAPETPRRALRHRTLETRLSALAAAQAVIWVRAPSYSGKRSAVAAWLRGRQLSRRPTWLVPADGGSAAASSARPLESFLAGEAAHGASRLLVLDLGSVRLSTADLDALRTQIARHPRAQAIVITDADRMIFTEGRADIELGDLHLPAEALREEFAALGVTVTEQIAQDLAGHAGDLALAAAYLASVSENPGLSAVEMLELARARATAGFVQRVAPDHACDLLTILTLLPVVREQSLGEYRGLPDAFVVLAQRGLISRMGSGTTVSYALPESLREVVRSILIGHYLTHRARLHRAAAGIALQGDDPAQAIAQYLAIPDEQAAMALFRQRWSAPPLDVRKAAGMLQQLSAADILADLELTAAAWLIRLGAEGRPTRGPIEIRLRRATTEEISRLDLPGRLTVRTAQSMSCLDRRDTPGAAAVVAEAFADLERAPLGAPEHLGHIYTTFLLSAARTAVYRGALTESSELYDEVLALPESAEQTINTYRAHIGRALGFTLSGELTAAQEALDDAASVAAGHAALHGRLDRIAAWCQGVIWNLQGHDELLDTLPQTHPAAGAQDRDTREWDRILTALRAQALLRKGFAMEAATLCRRAVDSLDAERDHPAIREWMISVLGLALTSSGQPGAALALTASIPPSADHASCLHAVRAFAQIVVGDPRAALQTTAECVEIERRHSKLPLIGVFLARSFAFEALGLTNAAEDAYLAALGLADDLGIRINLDPASTRMISVLHRRSLERAPRLLERTLKADPDGVRQPRADVPPELSDKERRILQYLMTSMPLGDIAEALFVSPNTVKTHVKNIYRKLGVQSRKQAADVAAGWGLGSAPLPGELG